MKLVARSSPHLPGACLGALCVGALTGCLSSEPSTAPPAEQDTTRTESVTAVPSVRVFVGDDGSTAAFAWQSDASTPYVRHFGPDGKLSWSMYGGVSNVGAPHFIATHVDVALHDGTVYTAFAQDSGYKSGSDWPNGVSSSLRIGKISKEAPKPISSAWKVWGGGGSYQTEGFIGSPRIVADATGTLYVLYGTKTAMWATGDTESTPKSNRRGLQLATCTTLDACTRSQVIDVEQAHRDRYDLAITDDGPVVAVTGDIENDAVHLYQPAGGSWAHTKLSLPGMGRVMPHVAAGAGRVVLAVNSVLTASWEPAPKTRYTAIYERIDGEWEQIAKLESFSVTSMQLRVGPDGISVFGRRDVGKSGSAGDPIGSVLHEADGWAAREIGGSSVAWASRGQAALGEDGALRIWAGSVTSWTEKLFTATPQPHRWAESESRGAGSLAGRDPCMVEGTVLELTGSSKVTVKAGSCVIVGAAGFSGDLTIDGTAQSPVHVYGGTIKSRVVDAEWTFFDGTQLTANSGAGRIALHRTSMSLRREEKTSGLSFSAPKTVATDAERTPITIRESLLGPYFQYAVRARGAVDLTIEDTTFSDTWDSAIDVATESGGSHLGAVVEASDFVRTRGAFRGESVTSGLPVTLTGLTVDGGTPATSFPYTTMPKEPAAAIFVRGGSGTIAAASVRGSVHDGIRLENVGIFDIVDSDIADNHDHGVVIMGQVPPGLGACEPVQQTFPQPGAITVWDPDPIIDGCRIENNGGAGIEVQYPSIPMQVHGNHVAGNGLEAFAIRQGRGLSLRAPDAACPTGFRRAQEVDVPLAPETLITGNDFLGNGAKVEDLQLASDHRAGTLPAPSNHWGTTSTSKVESQVACTSACTVLPLLTQPIP